MSRFSSCVSATLITAIDVQVAIFHLESFYKSSGQRCTSSTRREHTPSLRHAPSYLELCQATCHRSVGDAPTPAAVEPQDAPDVQNTARSHRSKLLSPWLDTLRGGEQGIKGLWVASEHSKPSKVFSCLALPVQPKQYHHVHQTSHLHPRPLSPCGRHPLSHRHSRRQ